MGRLIQTLGCLLRGIAVWSAIIVAESVHGTLRELLLKPAIGDLRARQISFFTAVALIFAIMVGCIRWVNAVNRLQLILIGISWVFLTTGFEAFVVRPSLGVPWESFYADYNVFEGGMMGFAMFILAIMPLAAARVRGVA